MKDFIDDFYIDPFRGDFWEGLVGVLTWILTLLLLGFVSVLLGWLIDSSFLPIKEDNGVVVEKYVIPAHSSTTYSYVGKVMIPHTTHYSDRYVIEIEINGLKDNLSLKQNSWSKVKLGDILHCSYTSGRIFNTIYIESIK